MIYAMSDIHGQHQAFLDMLEKIKFSDRDKMYIIGDVIDRGDSVALLKEIWSRDNIEIIMGNHEHMALESSYHRYVTRLWERNGGGVTFSQVKQAGIRQQFTQWLRSLPSYKVLEEQKLLLIHAGLHIRSLNSESLEEAIRDEGDDIYWNRPKTKGDKAFNSNTFGYTVICGHTPTIKYMDDTGDAEVLKINNSYNIDCGACYPAYRGRLCCMRLDDFETYYVDNWR